MVVEVRPLSLGSSDMTLTGILHFKERINNLFRKMIVSKVSGHICREHILQG